MTVGDFVHLQVGNASSELGSWYWSIIDEDVNYAGTSSAPVPENDVSIVMRKDTTGALCPRMFSYSAKSQYSDLRLAMSEPSMASHAWSGASDTTERIECEISLSPLQSLQYSQRSFASCGSLSACSSTTGSFNDGLIEYQTLGEEYLDNVQYFVESCDRLQGFQVFADGCGAMGGFSSCAVESLRDEYSKSDILVTSLLFPPPNLSSAKALEAFQIRNSFHFGMTMTRLRRSSNMITPILPFMDNRGSIDSYVEENLYLNPQLRKKSVPAALALALEPLSFLFRRHYFDVRSLHDRNMVGLSALWQQIVPLNGPRSKVNWLDLKTFVPPAVDDLTIIEWDNLKQLPFDADECSIYSRRSTCQLPIHYALFNDEVPQNNIQHVVAHRSVTVGKHDHILELIEKTSEELQLYRRNLKSCLYEHDLMNELLDEVCDVRDVYAASSNK